jgi:hypothetical protein
MVISSALVLGAAYRAVISVACCACAAACWSSGLVSTQYLISTSVIFLRVVPSVLSVEYNVMSGLESGS